VQFPLQEEKCFSVPYVAVRHRTELCLTKEEEYDSGIARRRNPGAGDGGLSCALAQGFEGEGIMSVHRQDAIHNKLLSLLPDADFQQIAPDLEYIALPRGTLIVAAGGPIRHVYFLTEGIGSVVATTPEGHRAEAGIFGFDGYVPTSAVAELDYSPHDVNIQLKGEGYRLSYDRFCECINTNKNFAKVMVRAMEAFTIQLAYTATSNAIHDVSERLARWLLMCHDRVQGNEIELTHEFLSLMLAVRRPSITTSLHILEGNGFIKAERGNITIRNRAALEEFAHDAYGKPEMAYRRLMKDLF
jgi:CRP-like cAMP-binding protein